MLVPLMAAFSFGSCAKRERESVAERNAEIDRRVDQRLEASHQAEERQRLAQRQAELETREKALAAQESSFATLAASLPVETTNPTPAEANAAPTAGSYSAADTYSAPYPDASSQIYPEQDGYVLANEPYLAEEPYLFAPATYFVTIVNQKTRIVHRRRNPASAGRGQHHPGIPPAVPRQPVAPPQPTIPLQPAIPRQPAVPVQMVTGRGPMGGAPAQSVGHRPTRSASAPQVVNRRPAARVAQQPNR